MKLSYMRYYITVAKYGSFTKASDRLFISQPTLSRTIQEIEKELGTQLFIRERHFLKMTEDGIRFLKEATEIVERIDGLSERFGNFDAGDRNLTALLEIISKE